MGLSLADQLRAAIPPPSLSPDDARRLTHIEDAAFQFVSLALTQGLTVQQSVSVELAQLFEALLDALE